MGSIICSVMMQQLNQRHPDNYLLAMRILWAPIGLMILCWIFIPESPWFHARRGDKEKAIKTMKQLYGGIKGYNFEEEYGIIARTIEHEKDQLQESPKYIHVFKGINLVSASDLLGEESGLTKKNRNVPLRLWSLQFPSNSLVLLSLAPTRHVRHISLIHIKVTNGVDFFSLAGLSDPFLCTVIIS